jgi:phospholipid-binding lipoprotein MlaA
MTADDRAMRALPTLLLANLLLASLVLSGCATSAPVNPDPRDPFERINRGTFAFNQSLDKAVVRPVLRGYRKVMPRVVRTGVSNAFANAEYPVVILNDLLQGKLGPAANDMGRFLLNTTLGIGGLLDPASDAGLDRNNEDFGQTLGHWGVRPGPYVMMPLLGPYTLRDGLGGLADNFAEPRQYIDDNETRWLLWGASQLNRRAGFTEAEAILDRSGDPYAFVRSAYLQRRQYLVTDGAAGDEPTLDEDPALEDPALEDPEPEAPALQEGAAGDTPTAPK